MPQKRRMTSWAVTAFGAALLAAGSVAPAAPKQAESRLVVQCTGIDKREGTLRVSVYDQPRGFPDGDMRYAFAEVPLAMDRPEEAPGAVSLSFDDVPPGTYAVCVYHDKNGNGKLDLDFLGRPREDWGVSNNPRRLFRAPRFGQAKFRLAPAERKTVVIAMRH